MAPMSTPEAGQRTPPASGPEPRSAAENARLRSMLDAHYSFIWRQLRRSGVPEGRVDDAAQEVFLVASQKLDAILPGSERSFLFGTALRIASQIRRSAQVRREIPYASPPELCALALGPDELLDQRRARALLDRVLDTLEEDVRVVLVLYELEGLSTPEIAELLEIPLGTAASRLRRAREDFQGKVSRLFPKGRPR